MLTKAQVNRIRKLVSVVCVTHIDAINYGNGGSTADAKAYDKAVRHLDDYLLSLTKSEPPKVRVETLQQRARKPWKR